jgi:hypothetical protein
MIRNLENILERLEQVTGKPPRSTWDGWTACCPAHDDRTPSLSIKRGAAHRILMKCHAGCETEAVVRALGLSMADLMGQDANGSRPTDRSPHAATPREIQIASPDNLSCDLLPSSRADGSPTSNPADGEQPGAATDSSRDGNLREGGKEAESRPVFRNFALAWAAATKKWGEPASHWEYYDRAGELIGLVLRWNFPHGKEIRPVSRVDGGWVLGAMDAPRPLFRLREVIESANVSPRVFVVEGEPAAQAGAALGLSLTTSSGGSSAAHLTDWSPLSGRQVILLPDHDPPGRKYAQAVIGQLLALRPLQTIRVINLPGLPESGDLVDFLDQRRDTPPAEILAELNALCEAAPPITAASTLEADPRGQQPESPGPGSRSAKFESPRSAASPITVSGIVRRLHECQPKSLRWLWPGRIPAGKLTLLVGDPGLGKSFLTLDLAARITRGQPFPSCADEETDSEADDGLAGSVVLLSAEDDVSDTICPRLIAAEADLSRVAALEAVQTIDPETGRARQQSFCLAYDLDVLEETIAKLDDCRLVVIDPITAYLGGKDSHNNAEIRELLMPLSALAARTGVAVLAINHLNKANQGPAIYRAMGSVAFAATARSALAVLRDPCDAEARVLVSLKNNLASTAAGLRYRVVSTTNRQAARVSWENTPIRMTAEEIMSATAQAQSAGAATAEACDWLLAALKDGSQSAAELKSLAKNDGIRERTLLRAKGRLGILTRRQGIGLLGTWTWELPPGRPHPPTTLEA